MSQFNYKEETDRLFGILVQLTDDNEKLQIRNKVIELNIKLVSQVLKKYSPYTADQFQNGCMGLIMAAQTYQPTREVPFSSYACFCIERELHMAYRKAQNHFENREEYEFISLDSEVQLGNGDVVQAYDITPDDHAEEEMNLFIEDNELHFVCDNIIKPSIEEVADRGRHMQGKLDIDMWIDLEFTYIMELVFIPSQKKRYNLTQMAKQAGISIQNVRNRHERVMDVIFERMWHYMNLSFEDLLIRLRAGKRLPERLLVFDPGKTTGWCLFENGRLTKTGQAPDCYDDKNINVKPIYKLIDEIQPDFVLYEDYKVYGHKLERHTFSPVFTVRLIGAIEAYVQSKDISSHKQMATTAKGFVTDDKLKQWGFWQTGERHARDAIRHACYFLLFYKKGQDIA